MSAAFEHLLPLLRDENHAARMRLADWDDALRLARQARLLGLIAHRLAARPELWARLPRPVRGHLTSAINYSAHRLQMVRIELRALDAALPTTSMRVVLLKGAAYIAQSLPLACGRMPNDVDLLVAHKDIDAAETALSEAGWQSEVADAYDQRYYRQWSHELPPMRYPGHALEVDLHHTIAPVTSRTRVDDELLFADLVPLPDSRFFVLDPHDQVIHAAIHLFQDSELDGRLRDLVDIDGLVRHHLRTQSDWATLINRAERHHASTVLWYALHYCRTWLATPVPSALRAVAPPAPARWITDWIMRRNCLPRLADRPQSYGERLAATLGRVRYHLLRMPPGLLARHLLHKTWLSARRQHG